MEAAGLKVAASFWMRAMDPSEREAAIAQICHICFGEGFVI